MRNYEIIFILKPSFTDEEIDKLIAQMEGIVKAQQGEVLGVEKMGKKKLAYRIGKMDEGHYILFRVIGNGECVKEFERRLKVADSVIRYITVRVDESMKRFDKIKAARLKKVRRKSAGAESEAAASVI
jgi:small subunit ribosomal protein S6